MKTFFKTRIRSVLLIVGAVVDVYSFIQIFIQTQFRMPALVSNPWFWLFVIVTVTVITLFLYFRDKDYKEKIEAQFQARDEQFIAYRKGVHEEFCKVYKQSSEIIEEKNKLYWQVQELKQALKVEQNG